jgi:hypothetical protein
MYLNLVPKRIDFRTNEKCRNEIKVKNVGIKITKVKDEPHPIKISLIH